MGGGGGNLGPGRLWHLGRTEELNKATRRLMYSPFARGVAVAGVAATGIALSDRDRRDAVAGVANGSIRFFRAFGWGAVVSFDYKYR